VPDAVAAVPGITQKPGKTVSESVAAALEGRLRLLLIDNCEHALDAAAELIEGDPRGLGDGDDSGHQPRKAGCRCRAGLAGASIGCGRRSRLCRGEPVRRPRCSDAWDGAQVCCWVGWRAATLSHACHNRSETGWDAGRCVETISAGRREGTDGLGRVKMVSR
jgi:hypothetical protein